MDSYRCIKKIGEGSYGAALLCEHKPSLRLVVIKQVSLVGQRESERLASLQEATILSSLSHPCIIGHIESFEDNSMLCIVCEYAGELPLFHA
jgi:NIMA (never in mitosis gene a)-related kinase